MLHPYLRPFFMIGTHYNLRVMTRLWKFSSHNSHWLQRGESSRTMELNGNSILELPILREQSLDENRFFKRSLIKSCFTFHYINLWIEFSKPHHEHFCAHWIDCSFCSTLLQPPTWLHFVSILSSNCPQWLDRDRKWQFRDKNIRDRKWRQNHQG